MKIRIKGNSVRLRLSKPEIELFEKEGYVEEKTEFATATFTYCIQKLFDGKTLDASFNDNKLTVYVPLKIMQEWVSTDKIGFDHQLPVTDQKSLFLLIEKDFKCIDEEEANQSDYYDNPLKSC